MKIKLMGVVVLSILIGACSSPESTEACEAHTASTTLEASDTALQVGETVTVTVTLRNEGCLTLGIPQYRLKIEPAEEESIFDPSQPEPIVHSLGVSPGQSDVAEFVLRAVKSGQATLSASASFEVHIGYPGPAYWGASNTEAPLVVIVELLCHGVLIHIST